MLTFQSLALRQSEIHQICSDEGLTIETSAVESPNLPLVINSVHSYHLLSLAQGFQTGQCRKQGLRRSDQISLLVYCSPVHTNYVSAPKCNSLEMAIELASRPSRKENESVPQECDNSASNMAAISSSSSLGVERRV